MYHANINKIKAGEAILISDRANLTGKKISGMKKNIMWLQEGRFNHYQSNCSNKYKK